MPYCKAQHEVFIRAVIRHGDQHLAYRQAYPKASKESAYTAAIRLLRQPHIQQRVAAAIVQHAQQEQERQREREEHKRRMAEEDTLQKRIWLARVVRGEVMKQRYMQFHGRTILVHETLSPFIILAAIELDTKYEYGTNPKIILDRQFARLYARATRSVGLALINRTSPRCGSATTSPFKGGTETFPPLNLASAISRAKRVTPRDAPQGQGDVSRKNTQNASKKLTDSNVNPRPAILQASNIPAVCNKIEGRPVQTSPASTKPAETHLVILSEVECNSTSAVILSEVECNETQRRTCLIKHTSTSRQILREAQNDSLDWAASDTTESRQIPSDGRNDSLDGAPSVVILSEVECNETQRRTCLIKHTSTSRQILREAQNDNLDWAASDTTESRQIPSDGQNDSLDWAASDTTESRQIPSDGRNDSLDGAPSVVILSEVECNETQGRICLIKDTTVPQEILRDARMTALMGTTALVGFLKTGMSNAGVKNSSHRDQ